MKKTTAKGVPVIIQETIKISSNVSWQVEYYDHYHSLLFSGRDFHADCIMLMKYVEDFPQTKAFRYMIENQSVQLLAAFFPEEKKVRVASDRLSLELSLLHWFELYQHEQPAAISEAAHHLQHHIEHIRNVNLSFAPTRLELITYAQRLPRLWESEAFASIEQLGQEKMKTLITFMNEYKSSAFERVSDYALTLSASYALIRVNVLKFLALLPSLEHSRSGKEVKRLFLETLTRLSEQSSLASTKKAIGQNRALPSSLFKILVITKYITHLLPAFPLAVAIRWCVRKMAKRFIAGENIHKVHNSLKELQITGREATLDQLGELVVSDAEAVIYQDKVLELIEGLGKYIKVGEKNAAGIYKAHVSIKVSALSHNVKPHAYEAAYASIAPRLKKILLAAKKNQVYVNVDAEHYHLRDCLFQVYRQVLLTTPELRQEAQTGIVVQAYLKDASYHLNDILNLAKERQCLMPIRLVKGAYWDAETVEADAHNFLAPQFLNKEETDLHFRQLAYRILENGQWLQLSLASHNLVDHCWVRALKELRFASSPEIEHQCLHMTYEALSHALPKMQWPTRNYIPVGNLLVGMAYLVRRIMENSSQVGVLSIMRSHKKASKLEGPNSIFARQKQNGLFFREKSEKLLQSDFFNVPPVRLYLKQAHESFFQTLENFDLKTSTLLTHKASLHGPVKTILSPSTSEKLADIHFASNEDTEKALSECAEAFSASWWSQTGGLARYAILLRAAEMMTIKRYELATLIIHEAGKSILEALADVDEAIDFINFYVREEMKLQRRFPYATPRGVMAIIAPWNFPLAIPCGMVVSSLTAGNPTILKSAEQTPLIAQALVNLLHEVGVPKNILIHLPGEGETIGAQLVKDKRVAGVIFTGSKAVGQWIYENAAGQFIHFENKIMQKRVITEMGGKNAIILTNNCELDETVSGVIYSAFAHAGQKCSAASRILVHKEIKQIFIERLVPAVADLVVGAGTDPATYINPLINMEEKKRVQKTVQLAIEEIKQKGGVVHLDRSQENLPGASVGPVIFEVSAAQALDPESWSQKEIFGPVIHIIPYSTLDEAVKIFNATQYALTGGIYSQSQDDVDYLLDKLKAGNLYVNRPNTGARVGIEPFGGFKLSGTGPKAGSREYLKSFHLFNEKTETTSSTPYIANNDASDFEYYLPTPSQLTIEGRKNRLHKVMQDFIENYDDFSDAKSSLTKEKIVSFFKYLRNDLTNYKNANHPNLMIPGQLSYNSKHFIHERGAFVLYNEYPSLRTLLNFFAAISLGCGVILISRNQKSAQYWSRLIALFYHHGFSKANLEHYYASEKIENKLLTDYHFSFLYIDANIQKAQEISAKLKFSDAHSDNMKVLLTNFDGPPYYDWDGFLDQFTLVRSFAINTMRHGAPLDLSI
ncbi:MAG: bifunctional proline dehydrogenase/L-glutamate gamma-semialdehyde dehydrogenase [Bacteriovoracaceae bacterium]|nr:bifunctional proline dehydrogenase/L-glutamate gamma-semialdehyde dehydrogenase [Bacteriovoracaceae bacterium]